MSKIYIVEKEWWYDGCPDMYYNCSENEIEKIFDSENKAIAYIQGAIKKALENADEDDLDEYIDHVPDATEIKEGEPIVYRDLYDEFYAYVYSVHEVE